MNYPRIFIVTATVLVTIALVGIAPVTAQEAPGEPTNFYGEVVDENGNEAPSGTTIVAVVDNEVEGEIVVDTSGQYGEQGAFGKKLALDSNAGDAVSFHIDDPDGPEALESPRNLDSGTFELDLTFSAGTFEDDVAVESVSVDLTDDTITVDSETSVTVISTLSDGSTEEVTTEADLKSDDSNVATIDGETVVSQDSGTAMIEVEYAGSSDNTEITVEESNSDSDSDTDDEDSSSDSDDSSNAAGGGTSGSTGAGESDSTDGDTIDDNSADNSVTTEDVRETISESEANTEAEIDLTEVTDDNGGDGGSTTIDASEETESVQTIAFQKSNLEGTVTIREYTNQDVTGSTAESIKQTIEDGVNDGIQNGDESEDNGIAEDDGDGSTDDTASGATTNSVSVVTVASISIDDPDTAATVTMNVDANKINDPQSVTIYHETEDSWEEIPTKVEDESDEEITFSGETDSFSLFAVTEIGENNSSATQDPEKENEGDIVNDSEETNDSIPGFGILVALVAIAAVGVLARRAN